MNARTSYIAGLAERLSTAVPRKPKAFDIHWSGERTTEIEEAFNRSLAEEYPFLSGHEQLLLAELNTGDEILAWAVSELTRVSAYPVCDENDVAKLLLLTSHFDWNSALWPELALISNTIGMGLRDILSKLIKTPDNTVTKKLRHSPISHNGGVEKLYESAQKHDWTTLSNARPHIDYFLYRQIQTQAIRALFVFDRQMLIRTLNDIDDVFCALGAIEAFEPAQALELATQTSSIVFKFLAFDKSLDRQHKTVVSYSELWISILTEVALDAHEWGRWLDVFNVYPARYPQLQHTMGKVLCAVSDDAAVASLKAIKMWSTDEHSREVLSRAFRVIHAEASLGRKTLVWRTAFKIWQEWDFGKNEQHNYLFKVSYSILDYAAVSYIADCLSPEDTEFAIKQLEQTSANSSIWWASKSDAISERFRLLSRYQPWAHVLTNPEANDDRLQKGGVYQPPWEDGSLYRSIRFDARERTF